MPTTRSRKTAKVPVQRGRWEATLRNVRAANARMRKLHTAQQGDIEALRATCARLEDRVIVLEAFISLESGHASPDEVTQ